MNRAYRIMLVEDSQTQAIKLTDQLERQGWQVNWTPTVDAAIESLNQHSPDLIVLDYYLPGIRGDEFCRRIRMNIDTRNIPILMLTMDDTHLAELHGLESGADDFVPKSLDCDILLARIRTLLGKSRSTSSVFSQADQCFRRARLLTIDDSTTFQQFLASELEKEGYQIETAMNGRDGIDRLSREPFDCALVDLIMPEIDGIEVCRRVKELRETTGNSVGLLMLTARESKEDLTQALEAGADDFVGKSSDLAVLKGRIRALLRRKFFEQENRRIVEELKNKELEMLQARADKEVAEARAALNEELEHRVTERTTELAKANRDLAEKSRENEMFVYSVSHDLRSPLVNLQGFSKELGSLCENLRGLLMEDGVPTTVQDRGQQLLDGDIQQAIHFIQSGVMRLSTIIDALLRLSRAGRVDYQYQCVDMQATVRRIVESISGTAFDRGAAITIGDLPPVWGDAAAIEQVFANLIQNALSYLDPTRPGHIEIVCRGCGEDCESGFATYYVQDNGLGIAAAYTPKVFQIFKRFHGEAAKGEGIGLAIVRRTVERHGGAVWVESQEGIGSRFFVRLPLPDSRSNVPITTRSLERSDETSLA